MLAVFSTACSSSSSDSSSSSSGDSSSSSNKKADSKGSAKVSVKTECELKEKDLVLHQGQTKEFSYSCSIAQDVRGKTLTISYTPNSAIELAPTQFPIPDEEELTGDFTLKGLQISSTVKISTTVQVSIKIASYTEDFQFKVTQPYIPKIGEFTITPISPKNAAGPGAVSLGTLNRKLVVYKNDLYVFQGDKYFVSSNGINWTEKAAPNQKVGINTYVLYSEQSYLVFQDKLWALGTNNQIWSFDGNTWTSHNNANPKKALSFSHNDGTGVVWKDKIWLLSGDGNEDIHSSGDALNWSQAIASFPQRIEFFGAVVHQDQILAVGGTSSNKALDTVYSFDGKQVQKVGTLPKGNTTFGLELFAGGLVVVAGGYIDKGAAVLLKSLWYSPYGSYWHVIADDLTKGDTTDAPTGPIYSIVKWKPKTGSHSTKEALWISDNNKIYKITYTKS